MNTSLVPTQQPPKRPRPTFGSRHQNGITDPLWPMETPAGMTDAEYADYRGRVDKQEFMTLVRADVDTRDRGELQAVLRLLTETIKYNQDRKPSVDHMRPLEHLNVPESWRVTVTVGFGASLFVDRTGCDRFGIRSCKPTFLKVMPTFPGDAPGFSPVDTATDLAIVISSDHVYVNVAIARYLCEHFNRRLRRQHPGIGDRVILSFVGIEQGFGRPDKREFLRFDDGIDNLRPGGEEGIRGDLENRVYVDASNGEPDWCIDGSYLVYRKIRERLPVWEGFSDQQQAGLIGREKKSGAPLSRQKSGVDAMTPVYPDHKDPADGPLDAHIRKVQPRRTTLDLFGEEDLKRRFLRRPYPYFDGLGADGKIGNGLHFLAFMESIQHQFEHVTNMWQMNPDFPVPGAGVDALFALGVLETIDGGYYFCPPADSEYLGAGMFR
jgi:deferrochelatase/peroxidase EfeB